MRIGGGPLTGIRVVEFGGIGPGPYCGQRLADLGASVLVLDRPGGAGWHNPVGDCGKEKRTFDLATDEGRADAMAAISTPTC